MDEEVKIKRHVLVKGPIVFCSLCNESIEVKMPMQLIRYADLLKAFSEIHEDCKPGDDE
jgi:hypothetical protein